MLNTEQTMRIHARAFVLIPNLLALNMVAGQVATPGRTTPLIGTWGVARV